jgi:uncharacterized protein
MLTWDGTSAGGTMAVLKSRIAVVCLAVLLNVNVAEAGARATALNESTVGLLAADANWLANATDIGEALQHRDGLRIMPMVGQGTVQAIFDLVHLQGVDAAILPLDTLTYAKAQGLLDGLGGKISYVARLQPLRWVLLAKRNVENLASLNGKRIATGPTGSAGFVAGELLFNASNIEFARLPVEGSSALAALLKGQADAALVSAEDAAEIRIDVTQFHVLPLALPASLAATYSPAILNSDALPQMLRAGETVETVATPMAIMVFNWAKGSSEYRKLARFSLGLYADDTGLTLDTNLAAEIPGWSRHSAADEALTKLSLKKPTAQKGDAP